MVRLPVSRRPQRSNRPTDRGGVTAPVSLATFFCVPFALSLSKGRRRMTPPHAAPRIMFPGLIEPHRLPPPPSPDDAVSAARLGQRLAALAAALDVPGVWLFGPTDPGLTGPYGRDQTVIVSSDPAAPCRRRVCEHGEGGNACMKGIDIYDVMDAVEAAGEAATSGWGEVGA